MSYRFIVLSALPVGQGSQKRARLVVASSEGGTSDPKVTANKDSHQKIPRHTHTERGGGHCLFCVFFGFGTRSGAPSYFCRSSRSLSPFRSLALSLPPPAIPFVPSEWTDGPPKWQSKEMGQKATGYSAYMKWFLISTSKLFSSYTYMVYEELCDTSHLASHVPFSNVCILPRFLGRRQN